MAAAGWMLLLAALLPQGLAAEHNHSGEAVTYHVSAGQLFLLRCHSADSHSNITWSRGGRPQPSLPPGVEVRDGLLWFLPVQVSHHGSYTCENRGDSGSLRIKYGVSVSSERCPDPPETISMTQGVSEVLPCKQSEIFRLNNTRKARWMKDCRPVDSFPVDDDGFMRLSSPAERDAGIYTCLVDVTLDGGVYTAARSIRLTVNNLLPDTVFAQPEVMFPQQEVVVVDVGMSAELRCLVYVGFSEDNETLIFWTVNGDYTEDHKELRETLKFTRNRGEVYAVSTLSISNVHRRFLNVPFCCHIMSPVGEKVGELRLQEADHSALHTSVTLCFTASLALLVLAAAVLFFKVDLVLAYRKLLRLFSKQAPDGKLYDAYVSFLHADSVSSAETASFALQKLPEQLEERHGYSLYIRGRDDCPGEAVPDVIATTVRQCRRLIIILSPYVKYSHEGQTEEVPLCDNQNQLCYERKVGLHDALTQNDLRVILVEIGGPVDYSILPESLRYVKRKQGALKWKNPQTHKHKQLCSNRNFWKNLRYHMPSVPAGRRQTTL